MLRGSSVRPTAAGRYAGSGQRSASVLGWFPVDRGAEERRAEERRAEELLDEQVAYYRARAAEYDNWWERTGVAYRGEEHRRRWFLERKALEDALAGFGATGDVLELAAGTGNWTRHLVRTAASLTVVDASPEVLAINRVKLGPEASGVTYVEADLFGWEPQRRYDVVFFSFWLGHVPPALAPAFWALVDRALAPGGRVFLIDSRLPEGLPAGGQVESFDLAGRPNGSTDLSTAVAVRTLDDGRRFSIVKRFWLPENLQEELAQLGWNFDVRSTGESFVYASGKRSLETSGMEEVGPTDP